MTHFEELKCAQPEEMAEALLSAEYCHVCTWTDKSGACTFVETHPSEPCINGCRTACLCWLAAECKQEET